MNERMKGKYNKMEEGIEKIAHSQCREICEKCIFAKRDLVCAQHAFYCLHALDEGKLFAYIAYVI